MLFPIRLVLLATVFALIYTELSAQCPETAPEGSVPPSASFSLQIDCNTVQVTAATAGNNSYVWGFGNGQSGAGQTTTHTYNPSGDHQYEISLTIVDNVTGCTSSSSQSVVLYPAPVLSDPLTSFTNCDGGSFSLSVYDESDGSGISNYSIDWGDGSSISDSTAPSGLEHTYTENGIFTIIYTITADGCSNSITQTVTNVSNPAVGAANPGNTADCLPEICFPITNTEDNDPITVYTVDFGDGTEILTFSHDELPPEICHEYLASSCETIDGAFTFSIIATTGACIESEATISPIIVYSPPIAGFVPEPSICAGQSPEIENTTQQGFNQNCQNTTIYDWDFGDGSPIESELNVNAPDHDYILPGQYSITLTAKNFCGESDFQEDICVENDNIVLSFLTDAANNTICQGETVSILSTNLSPIPICPGISYEWDIESPSSWDYTSGDDNTELPTMVFTEDGVFDLDLTVGLAGGACEVTATIELTVLEAASGVFDENSVDGCLDSSGVYVYEPDIDFASSVSDSDVNWDFAGGTPQGSGSGLNPGPVHFYTEGGPYAIVANVNSGAGCGSVAITQMLTIYQDPEVSFSITGGDFSLCLDDQISFNNQSSSGVEISYEWSVIGGNSADWDFVDGTDSSSENPQIQFLDDGEYEVLLQVESEYCGTVELESNTVTVYDLPSFTLSGIEPVCEATQIDFAEYVEYDNQESFTSLQWSFGINSIQNSDEPYPIVSFDSPDSYEITLIAINDCGELESTILFDFVDTNVGINYPADTLCQNDEPIDLQPTDGDWSGEGVSSVFGNYKFDPSELEPGTYELNYNFDIGGDCTANNKLDIVVLAVQEVLVPEDFQVCTNQGIITLSDFSPAGGTWSGPGVSANGEFDQSSIGLGSYELTYSLIESTNSVECQSSASLEIEVYDLAANAGNNEQAYCDLDTVYNLVGSPSSGGSWIGSSITAEGEFNPSLVDLATGVDTLIYLVVADNCEDSDTLIVQVSPVEPIDAGPNMSFCQNEAAIELDPQGAYPSGTWSGPGAVGNLFDPAQANVGSNLIVLSVGSGTCLQTDYRTINVNPVPSVDANDEDMCLNWNDLQLTGSYSPDGVWIGENVSTSGLFSPTSAGTFNVQYIYVSDSLCRDTTEVEIYVEGIGEFGFGVDSIACINQLLEFSVEGDSGTSCLWDFGDGTLSEDCDPSHTYTEFGNFDITLTIETNLGCTEFQTRPIFITNPPLAGYTHDADTSEFQCTPFSVEFLNTSNSFGAEAEYTWSLGNGDSIIIRSDTILAHVMPGTDYEVNGINLSYTYQGDYIISDTIFLSSLSISNPCGEQTILEPIHVAPSPQVAFGPSLDDICSGTPLCFNNVSVGNPESYIWDFGDGSGLVFTEEPDTLCHPFYTDSLETTFTVTISATNDCDTDTGSFDILVLPNDVNAFFFTDTIEGCAPLTVNFEDYSTEGYFLDWDFGDGNTSDEANPTHTFTDPGPYEISLVATNGCAYDTAYQDIDVLPQPILSGIEVTDQSCEGAAVGFSSFGGANISAYHWDFGDGDSSSLAEPQHHYAVPGSYDISLTVYSSLQGCPATEGSTIEILPRPQSAFTVQPLDGCSPLEVSFTNESQNEQYYNWDFGNGEGSTEDSPTVTYTPVDTLTDILIQLIVSDQVGCQDTAIEHILLYPQPVADFAVDQEMACGAPASFSFENLSTGADGFYWDFGELDSITAANPTHEFTDTGTYTVTLHALNTYQCWDEVETTVTVHPLPEAAFTGESSACQFQEITFANNSQFATSYLWDFGDGFSSVDESPRHAYYNAGEYSVSLIANYLDLCADTFTSTAPIVIFPAISAEGDLITSGLCSPVDVFLSSQSIDALNYEWILGDGTIINGPDEATVSHSYEEQGEYEIKLIVTSANQCTDTLELGPVAVLDQPQANWQVSDTEGCEDWTLDVINSSENSTGVQWSFGQNNASCNEDTCSYTYTSAGTYTLQLIVDNQQECWDTLTSIDTVLVHPAVVADFTIDQNLSCADSSIVFFNLSTYGMQSQWDFGDGLGSSEITNPIYEYPNAGVYDVTLSIVSEFGCVDTLQQLAGIEIYPNPNLEFSLVADGDCEPLEVLFDNQTTSATDYHWDLDGDGFFDSYEQSPTSTFAAGSYSPVLVASYENLCADTLQMQGAALEVFSTPTALFDWSEPDSLNAPAQIHFFNQSTMEDSYEWDFGDGNTSFEENPIHQYYENHLGNGFNVTLTVSNGICPDVYSINIYPSFLGRLWIPNAMQPNSANDEVSTFKPKGIGIEKYKLEVFSQWGDKLFESNDLEIGWDGSFNGTPQAQGVYVWKIEATFENGRPWPGIGKGQKTGHIHLIR